MRFNFHMAFYSGLIHNGTPMYIIPKSMSSTTSSIITNDWNTCMPTRKPGTINFKLKVNGTPPSSPDQQAGYNSDDELNRWGWWQGYRKDRTLLGFDDSDSDKDLL